MLRELAWRSLWQPFLRAKGLAPYWDDLIGFETLSVRERRLDMARRLLSQIRYFGKRGDALPEWKRAAEISDPEALLDAWPTLPILTKQDLQGRFNPERLRPYLEPGGRTSQTGGSTGEPTRFHYDHRMRRAIFAGSLYARTRMGWKPGMRLLMLWGSDRDIRLSSSLRARLALSVQNHQMIAGFRVGDDTVKRFLRLVEKPCAVWGYSALLEFVARRVLEQGRARPHGRIHAAWNGGEMLYPEQSALFEDAFGVPIHNNYGGRELSTMAFQPRVDASLRVLRPLLHVEILNRDNRPCAPGEPGRLIWTSTVCRGTPFLRYEIGDLGMYDDFGHDESGIHSIRELHGRTSGVLTLPDGRALSGIFWNHLFKEFAGIERFQVVVRDERPIELRLKGRGLAASDQARLREILDPLLAPRGFEIEWVESFERTHDGKLEQVVRK